MRNSVESFWMTLGEIWAAHKPSVITIISIWCTSIASILEAIPAKAVGNFAAVIGVVAGFLLAVNHYKSGKKSDLESKLLEIQIEKEKEALEAAREQRRRKEDKEDVE